MLKVRPVPVRRLDFNDPPTAVGGIRGILATPVRLDFNDPPAAAGGIQRQKLTNFPSRESMFLSLCRSVGLVRRPLMNWASVVGWDWSEASPACCCGCDKRRGSPRVQFASIAGSPLNLLRMTTSSCRTACKPRATVIFRAKALRGVFCWPHRSNFTRTNAISRAQIKFCSAKGLLNRCTG